MCIDQIQPFSSYWVSTSPSTSQYSQFNHDSRIRSAILHPNQVSRTFLSLTTGSNPSEQLDLLQGDTVAGLAKLVQGQLEINPRRQPKPVTLLGGTSSSVNDLPEYIHFRQSHRLRDLRNRFPTISVDTLQRIFPLFDPLDLDILISWSVPSTGRHGHAFLPSLRLAPEFSVVEGVRREVDAAIACGGKQTRTMYEETGRLRRVLMDSVFEGLLAREEDPVVVRVSTNGKRCRGVVEHDFGRG